MVILLTKENAGENLPFQSHGNLCRGARQGDSGMRGFEYTELKNDNCKWI
jgi:hypothetical protein